jgi:ribosomal-protein-alanine N-acetyltransferase
MSNISEEWVSSAPSASGRQLIQVPLPVLEALANGDLESANSLSPHDHTPYLISKECRGVWGMRRDQVTADPGDGVWVTRLLVDTETGGIVGRAGFHGPPDQVGMLEVGYAIDPLFRRQGHARAALKILLEVAAGDSRVNVVRASVRPDNLASRALIDQYGFHVVGEQWDDEDGLEVILEVSV